MARVLVVDDERLICDLLRTVLAQRGYEVAVAESGREALRLFEEHRPAVTLLDLNMPEMGGLAVLSQLRSLDPAAAVIVVTGMGTPEAEAEARRLGASGFLRKGTSLTTILAAVEAHASRDTTRRPANPPVSASILVVDDEESVRRLLVDALGSRGYSVVIARNGHEALLQVDYEHPAVIVLDLAMPSMNGLEVLLRLREQQYRGQVLILTGLQDETVLREAKRLGPTEVIGKPIDLDLLIGAIDRAVSIADACQRPQLRTSC